jgi:hypothetical protein
LARRVGPQEPVRQRVGAGRSSPAADSCGLSRELPRPASHALRIRGSGSLRATCWTWIATGGVPFLPSDWTPSWATSGSSRRLSQARHRCHRVHQCIPRIGGRDGHALCTRYSESQRAVWWMWAATRGCHWARQSGPVPGRTVAAREGRPAWAMRLAAVCAQRCRRVHQFFTRSALCVGRCRVASGRAPGAASGRCNCAHMWPAIGLHTGPPTRWCGARS